MVECGGLENRCRRKATGGSNPPLSEGFFRKINFIVFIHQILWRGRVVVERACLENT